MTWRCVESEESKTFTDNNGVKSMQRAFHVWSDDEDLSDSLLVYDKFGTTPTTGDALPGYFSLYPTDTSFKAVSPDIRPVNALGEKTAWKVTWTYQILQLGQKQPNDVGFVEFTANGRSEFRDKWRIVSNIPASGGVFGSGVSPWSDIAGQAIDIAGEPLSALHITQDITISVTLGGPPQWNVLRSARGRRNAFAFGGIPPGYLVFADYSVSRVTSSRYRVSYRMVEDQDAHLVQNVFRDVNGQIPKIQETVVASGTAATRAAYVLWAQPFPNTIDFYSIDPFFAGQI